MLLEQQMRKSLQMEMPLVAAYEWITEQYSHPPGGLNFALCAKLSQPNLAVRMQPLRRLTDEAGC